MFVPPRIELPPEAMGWTSWSSTGWDPPQTARRPVCAVCAEPLRLKHAVRPGHDHAAQVDLFPQPANPAPSAHVCPTPERHDLTYLLVKGVPGFVLAAYFLTAMFVTGIVVGWALR